MSQTVDIKTVGDGNWLEVTLTQKCNFNRYQRCSYEDNAFLHNFVLTDKADAEGKSYAEASQSAKMPNLYT